MKARVGSGSPNLSPDVRKAMEAEAGRMAKEAIDQMNRENEEELDAMVLYILHSEFGFGEKRLRRFYDSFSGGLRDLGKRYAMESYDDRIWLCRKKLKDECGIDISEWGKEKSNESGQGD